MVLGAIFDMDGVLVDSSEAHHASWSRLGDEIGTPFPRALFDRTFGMHNNQIIPLWLGDVPADEVERLGLRKEEIYRASPPHLLRALPGAQALVAALAADGWRLAVASSGTRANIELILRLLDLKNAFHFLATGDDVTHGKPHPEVFLKAVAGLGLAPAACAVIEDAPQGVEAGLTAGATVLAVTSTRPAADLAEAHYVVDSLENVTPASLRDLVMHSSPASSR